MTNSQLKIKKVIGLKQNIQVNSKISHGNKQNSEDRFIFQIQDILNIQ